MGKEARCTVRYGDAVSDGKAMLETDALLFRGDFRLTLPLAELQQVGAVDGWLHVVAPQGEARFHLGPQASRWAEAILYPPTRLSKLGLKPGMTVAVRGDADAAFLEELDTAGAIIEAPEDAAEVDMLFFVAQKRDDLAELPAQHAALKPAGALWVVYPKGIARIREIDVLHAGRAAGLVDTKVASFSSSHTALKFVIPRAKR